MEMTDKDRYQKIRDDLGPICGIVEQACVEEGEPCGGSRSTALQKSRSTPTARVNGGRAFGV
jgi:hypothetical protein